MIFFLQNSSILGVFWPRRGLQANHGTVRKSAILPQAGNQKRLKCSMLAGGYWGFHRGKPVPFANRAPSLIFEARAPGYERASAITEGGKKMEATKRTPGFLGEEKLQRLQVGYLK